MRVMCVRGRRNRVTCVRTHDTCTRVCCMRSSSTDAHALQDENSVLKEVLEKTINEVRAHMQCPRARASVCCLHACACIARLPPVQKCQ